MRSSHRPGSRLTRRSRLVATARANSSCGSAAPCGSSDGRTSSNGQMPRLQLRTLGTISLTGPTGAIPLDEPRLVALIVMLAIAGDAGVSEDELLLRLTPDAKPAMGRAEIGRLIAV